MKKILLSSVAILGFAAAASAADLPRRTAPVVYAPVPVFTWTGFYAGVNAGYGFGVNDSNRGIAIPAGSIAGSPGTAGTLTFTDSNQGRDGFVGGGQIGYNYQFTPGSGFVIGIEADAQYADFNNRRNDFRSYTFVGTPGLAFTAPAAAVVDTRNALDFFGTVRGRVGYAFDRTLVYATGGFAYGDGENNYRGTTFANFGDTFRTGYAVGGGVEFALAQDSFLNFFGSSAVTMKIEGLYVNLERDRFNTGSTFNLATNTVFLAPTTRRDREEEFAVVRAGLNYKFGTY